MRTPRRPAMADPIILYADGLCEPRNPGGWACWGWLALDGGGQILAQDQGCLGCGPGTTNNQAEYESVLQALRWAYQQGHTTAIVRSDSQIVIRQATGAWSCNAPGLVPLLARVRKAAGLMQLPFEWVPREENTAADALSRAAYTAATGQEAPERPQRPAIPANPANLPVRECETCHAPILWARHRLSNKPAPLDAVPSAAG